jgi:hypothetical protein
MRHPKNLTQHLVEGAGAAQGEERMHPALIQVISGPAAQKTSDSLCNMLDSSPDATKEKLAGRLQYLGQLDAHRDQIRRIRSMVNRSIRTI